MASALASDLKYPALIACDKDSSAVDIARRYIGKCQLSSRVHIELSMAMDILKKYSNPKETDKFDMIFLDADKGNLSNYIEEIIRGSLLCPHDGVIIIDNVLFRGLVLSDVHARSNEPHSHANSIGQTVHHMNKMVSSHPCVSQYSILPMFDGIGIVRLRPCV